MDSVSRQLLLSAAGATPPPTAPLSIWTMESISGNTVPDSVGSLTGTKSGGSVVTGRVGNALRLSLASDYISMGRASRSTYDTASTSLAMWIKFNSLSATAYLASNHCRTAGAGSIYNNGSLLYVTSSGAVGAANVVLNNETWTDGGVGGSTTNYSPAVSTAASHVTTGNWYHIVVVSLANSITLYVNKAKIGTTTHSQNKRTGSGDSSVNGLYSLGNWVYDNTSYFTAVGADIDETRHYNYGLTDSNVEWLYANT